MEINSDSVFVYNTTTLATTTNVTASTGGALNVAGDLVLGATLYIPLGGSTAPTVTNRSDGTKIVLYPSVSAVEVDYAIGLEENAVWQSVALNLNTQFFKWYGGTSNIASLDGVGNFTLAGTVDGRDIATDGSTLDTLNTTLGLGSLTAAEVTQLQGIDSVTISNTQWGYLGCIESNPCCWK